LAHHRNLSSEDDQKIIYNILITHDGKKHIIESVYQDSNNTHGTGCSLACEELTIEG